MLRSVLLTFRMHRFEVLLVVVLLGLTAVSAVIAESHVGAADPGADCWMKHWAFEDPARDPECEAKVNSFWATAEEASFVASPLAVSLPFIVGLLLGVPIVGRELELRTAGLAWSLSGRRWRWLLARFLPVLVLGFGGLVVVALLVADMARVAHPWNYLGPGRLPDLHEIGSEGMPLAARGLMTIGIGLLTGALIGRTLPAFAIGAIAVFALLFIGAPLLQARVAADVAIWQDSTQDKPVLYVPGVSGNAYRAPDGTILSYEQTSALAAQECPDCDGPEPWASEHGYVSVSRVAPIESYATFENAEMLVTSAIGLACIVLTFPIVSRRRPT